MILAALTLLLSSPDTYTGGRVSVEPVFLVPKGEKDPSEADSETLVKHLKIAQARYLELLRKLDTFKLIEKVRMFEAPITAGELKAKPNGGAEYVVSQLLKHDGYTRWNCPRVYVVVYMGTGDYPPSGGRPINGGHDQGGGIVTLSRDALVGSPFFQSTLQFDLGHAFGLPAVEEYGYDMNANGSIMSSNPALHTNFFEPSKTPGIFNAEELRTLGDTKWIVPDFKFNRDIDCPAGYVMQPDSPMDPMDLTAGD